jgi:hypothetical protein
MLVVQQTHQLGDRHRRVRSQRAERLGERCMNVGLGFGAQRLHERPDGFGRARRIVGERLGR